MDRIAALSEFASAPVDLTARPRRRWSDGANYPWSLGDEDASASPHWPTLVALLCEQVARGCDDIGHQLDGNDTQAISAISASTQDMREMSMALQQIVRLASGSFRPQPEHMDMARAARRLSHERLAGFLQRRVEIRFDIRAAEAMIDASVADRLMNAALDWAMSFSRRVRFKLGVAEGASAVHLVVRATLPSPSQLRSSAGVLPRERRMNDNVHWILLRQLAQCAQLPISRSSTAATEAVVIQFPLASR
jgi:hypothetical protein